jgi:hypothetical protein
MNDSLVSGESCVYQPQRDPCGCLPELLELFFEFGKLLRQCH